MPILEPTVERRDNLVRAPIKRVSWASISSGVVVGLAVSITLALLGVAARLLGPGRTPDLEVVSGTTWAFVAAISFFAGGWTAGRLCGLRRNLEGAMHGIVTWAVLSLAALVFTSVVTTGLGSFPFGSPQVHFLTDADIPSSTRPEVVKPPREKAHTTTRMQLERYSHALIERTTLEEEEKAALEARLQPLLFSLADAIYQGSYAKERAEVIGALHASTEVDWPTIETEVDRWIVVARAIERVSDNRARRFKRWRQKKQRAGARGVVATQSSAGWSFLFLLLGAAAAMVGGWLGTGNTNPRPGLRPADKPSVPQTPGRADEPSTVDD